VWSKGKRNEVVWDAYEASSSEVGAIEVRLKSRWLGFCISHALTGVSGPVWDERLR
jgi:hypothetical protein